MFPMFPIDTASLGYTLEKKNIFGRHPTRISRSRVVKPSRTRNQSMARTHQKVWVALPSQITLKISVLLCLCESWFLKKHKLLWSSIQSRFCWWNQCDFSMLAFQQSKEMLVKTCGWLTIRIIAPVTSNAKRGREGNVYDVVCFTKIMDKPLATN